MSSKITNFSLLYMYIIYIMDNQTKFGKVLKELRVEHGLTQKQLASKVNATQGSIADWENRGIEPPYTTLCKLCEIFDVTAGQLLGIEDY